MEKERGEKIFPFHTDFTTGCDKNLPAFPDFVHGTGKIAEVTKSALIFVQCV